MQRFGRKIRWTPRAVVGFTAAVLVILAVSQVPNFLWVWMWGPNTGYRSAGLTTGHFQRKYPAIVGTMPQIGLVFVGGGESLVFDYDIEIAEGSASFSVWKWPSFIYRPNRVGPKSIRKSESGRITFTAPSTGVYRIFMYAHRLQGAVAVDWRTHDASSLADASGER